MIPDNEIQERLSIEFAFDPSLQRAGDADDEDGEDNEEEDEKKEGGEEGV